MPNFNTILDRHEAVACKGNRIDIFCRLSTMHERDRQTDRQTDCHRQTTKPRNGNIVRNHRNRRNRLLLMSPNNTNENYAVYFSYFFLLSPISPVAESTKYFAPLGTLHTGVGAQI